MGSVRSSPYFNNPAVGQAVANIASFFGPPDAGEVAAYAAADARRAEAAASRAQAAREAEAYGRMTADGVTPADVDRFGVAVGRFNPTQSYRALDMGDATIRRGQDLESGDRRYTADKSALAQMYGDDRAYASSTENNVRDNDRAVQTNAADNTRALEDRRMQEAGALQRFYGAPVVLKPGERAYLPNQTAAATGLPGQLEGNANPLSSDEVIAAAMQAMPPEERQRLARNKFAPTETQIQGQLLEGLRNGGVLTDEMVSDRYAGEKTPVEAIGPDGKPVYMSPGEAVRMGAQVAPKGPSTVINNGPAGDNKLREKLDENEGKRWSELQGVAATSSGLRQDLELMGQLIEQAPQGPIIGRLAEYFPEATTAGAAFQSVVSRAAPGLRVEGSGATSDVEYEGMVRSLPRLRNDPQANRLIVGMMGAKAELNVRRGEIVNAYQNGRLDAAQARDQLAALNRQSILSPGLRAMIEQAGGGQPSTSQNGTEPAPTSSLPAGAIEDGYRFKGGDPADAANWELAR